MKAWQLDLTLAASSSTLLFVLIVVLPRVISAGPAYVIAVTAFVLCLTGGGYLVSKKTM